MEVVEVNVGWFVFFAFSVLVAFIAGGISTAFAVNWTLTNDPVVREVDELLPRIDGLVMLLEKRENRAMKKSMKERREGGMPVSMLLDSIVTTTEDHAPPYVSPSVSVHEGTPL